MILDCTKPEFLLSIPAAQFGRLIGELQHLRTVYANYMGPLNSNVPEVDELLAAADAEFACAERGRAQPARAEVPLVRTGPGGDYVSDWPTDVGRVSPADSPEPRLAATPEACA